MGNFSGVPLVQSVHAASPCRVLQHRELLQHLFWHTLPAVLWPAAPQVPPSLSGLFKEGPQGDISDGELPSRWLPGELRDGVSAGSCPGPPQGKCSAQSASAAHSHAGARLQPRCGSSPYSPGSPTLSCPSRPTPRLELDPGTATSLPASEPQLCSLRPGLDLRPRWGVFLDALSQPQGQGLPFTYGAYILWGSPLWLAHPLQPQSHVTVFSSLY